ncbi:hypothetical protein QN277_005215 [Acacia crassicarpa]|nr:hypothetical protein QN277_005215 [Acacia crassicarpa]
MEPNYSANAKRKKVGSCGHEAVKNADNGGDTDAQYKMLLDENYQLFLKTLRTDGNNMIYMPENGVAVVYGEGWDQSSTDSEPIILPPSQHCDENYQLFLKSLRTDGNNMIYMPENGVAVVYGEGWDQSSTDSEPIILPPSQHYEDSPFICSETNCSFCLADERNQKDSLYRKGLMEELERPYNQKELHKLLQVASHERPKEIHREMRHGVTKDRPKRGGDNKTSYLKMQSGLQNAINQVKEPRKVLFLLHGFFYWLKHLPEEGAFTPWLDASCLKMLQEL